MSKTSMQDIKDCVFIVKDGVIVDDSLPNVVSIKDLIIYNFSKSCIASISQHFQVVVINRSDRYHQRVASLDQQFMQRLGIFVPCFYVSEQNDYSDLFEKVKSHIMPDFEKSYLIGSRYEDAIISRRMGFKETFIVRTGIRQRDPDEHNRLACLEPAPIMVDSLYDVTRCLQLLVNR